METLDFSFHEDDSDEAYSPVKSKKAKASSKASSGQTIYDWDIQDLKTLCKRIRESSLKVLRSATIAYNKAESRMNWDEVAFGGRSAEECRVKWQQLSANVRNFRTLAEMVMDSERWLDSKPRKAKLALTGHPDKPTKPASIFIRYMMEELPKLKSKYPDMPHKELVRKIGEMYKRITPARTEKLKADWQRENEDYLIRLEKFYVDHPEAAPYTPASNTALSGRAAAGTAFMYFVTDKIKNPKFANLTKDELRAEWAKLKDEKKVVYIEAALEINRRNEVQSSTLIPKQKCDVLSKDEREVYDRFLGKPTRPPYSGFALFKSIASVELKDLTIAERNKEFQTRWSMMSREEQNKFHNEVKLMKQTFDVDMTEYLRRLKQREQHLIENGPGIDIKAPLANGQNSVNSKKRGRFASADPLNEMISSSPTKDNSKAIGVKTEYIKVQNDSEVDDVIDAPPMRKQRKRDDSLSCFPMKVQIESSLKRNAKHQSVKKVVPEITALSCYQESELDNWREVNPDLSDQELLKSIAEAFEELSEKKKAKWERKADKKRRMMDSGEHSNN